LGLMPGAGMIDEDNGWNCDQKQHQQAQRDEEGLAGFGSAQRRARH
jgi:hypothetical protein